MKNPKYYNTFFAPEYEETVRPPVQGFDPGSGGASQEADAGESQQREPGEFYPKTRREHFISALAKNPNATVFPPKARREYFYAKIGGEETPMEVVPKVREENMLEQFVQDVKIVPWSTGTDEEIAAMVAALDAGKITIADTGWQIGDEREVQLAAMEATGVGESHAAQTAVFVLMDSQHFDLTTATAGGDTKDHFVVGMKDCLNETGYMNPTVTNVGSWEACARRTWCNSVFRASIPQTMRDCFKQFRVITAETVSGTTNLTTDDYFSLPAVKEVFGTTEKSNETEAAALTQIAYYETAETIKQVNGSADAWWGRSPVSTMGVDLCFGAVGVSGSPGGGFATNICGLAPFGCI